MTGFMQMGHINYVLLECINTIHKIWTCLDDLVRCILSLNVWAQELYI